MYEQFVYDNTNALRKDSVNGIQTKLSARYFYKPCEFCGNFYSASSINSRYCSNACNIKACQYRKEAKKFPIEEQYFIKDDKAYHKTSEVQILKMCPSCKRWLPINGDFFMAQGKKQKKNGDKSYSYCRTCVAKKSRNRRKNHKDCYSSNETFRFAIYKAQAKKRDLEFKLSKRKAIELFNGVCFYCGYKSLDGSLNGIDRVDSSQGYTIENVVSCCKRCNYMKGAVEKKFCVSQGQWLKQIEKIYHYRIKDGEIKKAKVEIE